MTDIENTPAVTVAHDGSAAEGVITPKQATAILQFLQRTQMQGAEMPVYVDVFNVLSSIAASASHEAVAG